MPQMSNLPFITMSMVLVLFFVIWMVNMWFSTKNKTPHKKKTNQSKSNWPF